MPELSGIALPGGDSALDHRCAEPQETERNSVMSDALQLQGL